MKKIPTYKLKVDQDKSEVNYIALVDEPAIEINWIAFNKMQKFISDSDRRLIMGAAMVADLPIYRKNEEYGEHYVVLEKQEIQKIVENFFRKGYQSHFNIGHDPEKKKNGLYIVESIIVDESRGVAAPSAFSGLPQGSWIITVKVDDDDVWTEFIKTGKVRGFSIEGFFGYSEEVQENEVDLLNAIAEIIDLI